MSSVPARSRIVQASICSALAFCLESHWSCIRLRFIFDCMSIALMCMPPGTSEPQSRTPVKSADRLWRPHYSISSGRCLVGRTQMSCRRAPFTILRLRSGRSACPSMEDHMCKGKILTLHSMMLTMKKVLPAARNQILRDACTISN